MKEKPVKRDHMPWWERGDKVVFVNWRLVDSSNVEAIGWPISGEPLMLVRYKSGHTYGYIGVSRQRAVAAAYYPSVGHYINARVKGHFEPVKFNGVAA